MENINPKAAMPNNDAKKNWSKPTLTKYEKSITETEGSGAAGRIAPKRSRRFSLFFDTWDF